MKNILLFILVVFVITGKTFAYVTDPEFESDSATIDRSITLKLNEWKAEDIQLKIISNENGRLVYTDQLNGFQLEAKRYILNNLDEGHYKMELEDDMKFYSQHFVVVNKKILLAKGGLTKIYQPVIRQKGRFLDITMLVTQPRVVLKLMDDNGDEIYRANFKDKDQILRRIDLRHLRPGKYTLITSTGGQRFYKDFEI